MRPRHERGQSLVLIAALMGTVVMIFLSLLALATLYGARSHARQSLQVATAAGARRVDYESLPGGLLRLDAAAAISTTRTVFGSALALQSFGLDASAAAIAERAVIEVHNDVPWTSPYTGITHQVPTVVAVAPIPVRIFFFAVEIPVTAETEVHAP